MELEIRETELNTRKFHKVIAICTLGLCLPGAPRIRLKPTAWLSPASVVGRSPGLSIHEAVHIEAPAWVPRPGL